MSRILLILALTAVLLCSLATARPLADVSRTTTTTTTTTPDSSAFTPCQPFSPPPAPEHSGPGSTTPAANPPTHAAAAAAATASFGNAPQEDEPASAEAPGAASHQGNQRKHRPADKSVAGGEVILGGLVTAIFAAVFCYIRVTRKKSQQQDDEPIKS